MKDYQTHPLLIEIGTEDLPARQVQPLSDNLTQALCKSLSKGKFLDKESNILALCTHRRLALLIDKVRTQQADTTRVRRGPPITSAYDAKGNPTQASLGFARSCGIAWEVLGTSADKKHMVYTYVEKGKTLESFLQKTLPSALLSLGHFEKMRWEKDGERFVRPLRWMVILHGKAPLCIRALGVISAAKSHGYHRPHLSKNAIPLACAHDYLKKLEENHIQPQPWLRKKSIEEQIAALDISIVPDPNLLKELVMMSEWPIVIEGTYPKKFLHLPQEVRNEVLSGELKLFVSLDDKQHKFAAVLHSPNPDLKKIREGYEKVVVPKLADAAFFFDRDQKKSLEWYAAKLDGVIFHRKLGTLADKSRRIGRICQHIITTSGLGHLRNAAVLAAALCKADLTTAMVQEHPTLQGSMGRIYYTASAKDRAEYKQATKTTDSKSHEALKRDIGAAIEQHYWPTTAGGELPHSQLAAIVAIADKVDTLSGIFAAGETPSGSKDPYALRRACLGVVRILIDKRMDCDLWDIFYFAKKLQPLDKAATSNNQHHHDVLFTFVRERIRHNFAEMGFEVNWVDAVLTTRPWRVFDVFCRLEEVQDIYLHKKAEFIQLYQACKRLNNIEKTMDNSEGLAKELTDNTCVRQELFTDPPEADLYSVLQESKIHLPSLVAEKNYPAVTNMLVILAAAVSRFFDHVLVMHTETIIRHNRLCLVKATGWAFLQLADFAKIVDNR